jgi:hypothetical protein
MRIVLFVIGALVLISDTACAKQVADPEHQYRELWSEVAPPMAQRRKLGKLHVPVISELHHAILTQKASKEDRIKERSVRNVFSLNGLPCQNMAYFRVICRKNLCEYIIMYNPELRRKQEDRHLQSFRKVTDVLCLPAHCQASAVLGGNKINSGLSVLGYFIPNNSGFM